MIYTKSTIQSLALGEFLDYVSTDSDLEFILKDTGLCGNVGLYKSGQSSSYDDLVDILFLTSDKREGLLGTPCVAYPIYDSTRMPTRMDFPLSAAEQYQYFPLWEGRQLELRRKLASILSYELASIQL